MLASLAGCGSSQRPAAESAAPAGGAGAPAPPIQLTVGDRARPLNVEGPPLFGWLPRDGPNELQSAYQIDVARADDGTAVWDSGKVVSDQYKASVVRTVEDKTYVGKVVNDANGVYTIVVDPEDSTKVAEVKKADVADLKPSNVSLMPEKLLNQLNEAEVLDMLAYMLSRGDPNHPMFKK